MMSEAAKTRNSRLRKVAARDLKTEELEGLVSTNSFSFSRKVGSSMQMQAMTDSTMKQIR